MLPFKSLILLNRNSDAPLYRQISSTFVELILKGKLVASSKLPSERELSNILGVNRQTIIKAYEELNLQGWVTCIPKIGTLVNVKIPEFSPQAITATINKPQTIADFNFKIDKCIAASPNFGKTKYEFNDGSPDFRLAPIKELANAYKTNLSRKNCKPFLTYTDASGEAGLRNEFSKLLCTSRGLCITKDNILITRGSQMGIYLIAQSLFERDDIVVVAKTNYYAADATFEYVGAKLVRIEIDQAGIDTDSLRKLCRRKKIKAVYITPHHHYPTTVTMSMERRLQLLELSVEFDFVIIEDDYDYDFHYRGSPILPLASIDNGRVIYIGSMSKIIASAFRVGFVSAPANFIKELSKVRSIIDRQGDNILELSIAELFKNGDIKRYLRKTVSAYKDRRDLLCSLLLDNFEGKVSFQIPDGGMAIWAKFDKKIDLVKLSSTCKKENLYLSDGIIYDPSKKGFNACRMGFASMNPIEIQTAMNILKNAMRKI